MACPAGLFAEYFQGEPEILGVALVHDSQRLALGDVVRPT